MDQSHKFVYRSHGQVDAENENEADSRNFQTAGMEREIPFGTWRVSNVKSRSVDIGYGSVREGGFQVGKNKLGDEHRSIFRAREKVKSRATILDWRQGARESIDDALSKDKRHVGTGTLRHSETKHLKSYMKTEHESRSNKTSPRVKDKRSVLTKLDVSNFMRSTSVNLVVRLPPLVENETPTRLTNRPDRLPVPAGRKRADQEPAKERENNNSHILSVPDTTLEVNSEKKKLCSFIDKDIIGSDLLYPTPLGNVKATYLDYTASGRPLKCIETYIRYHVMPTYANTHTEANFNAIQTTKFREDARQIIRKCVKANKDDCVIFTGSGSTSAINKLVHALNLKKRLNSGPTVFTGPYEHHSNIFPWKEASANVVRIRQTPEGLIDLTHLEVELKKMRFGAEKLLIGSFSAASNVTGILTDVNAIARIMHEHKGYAFFDYACAAPYVDIEMNPKKAGGTHKDAIFISPHKFVGGPQTPGILVAKRWVFRNSSPHNVGGGTVKFVRREHHVYLSEPERREEGGTPAIIETIRAGLVFKLKDTLTAKFIMDRDNEMLRRAIAAWRMNHNLILLGSLQAHRLPIFAMLFANPQTGRLLHHDFVALVLNDVFGIQVRSGCACAAPYVLDLLGMEEKVAEKYEKLIATPPDTKTEKTKEEGDSNAYKEDIDNVIFKPGFVRLNFPYFISEACFVFVVKAILMTAEKGWTLLPWYDFNKRTGKWKFRENSGFENHKSLNAVTFENGKLEVRKPPKRENNTKTKGSVFSSHVGETTTPSSTMSSLSSSHEGFDYFEILERADIVFKQAETAKKFDSVPDQTKDFSEEEEELRWFVLPIEAANLLHQKEVKMVNREDFPFHPGTSQDSLYKEKDNRSFLIPYLFLLLILLIILFILILVFIVIILNDEGENNEANGDAQTLANTGQLSTSPQQNGTNLPPGVSGSTKALSAPPSHGSVTKASSNAPTLPPSSNATVQP